MTETAKRILDAMMKANVSYGELSDATGIAKSSLQRYASGFTPKIPLDRIDAIARALNTTPSYLMCWTDDPSLSYTESTKKASPLEGEETLDEFDEIADTLLRLARRSGNTSPLTTQQKNAIEAAVRLVSAATDEELTPQQSATLDAIASLLMTNFDGSK